MDYQVFGERCSGTNYLDQILNENFKIKAVHHYGWKHGFPTMPGIWRQSLCVVITRAPFDWLRRFYRTPYEMDPNMSELGFSEWIRSPWHSICRPRIQGWEKWGMQFIPNLGRHPLQLDRHPIEGRAFSSVCEMRTLKYRAWFGLKNRASNFLFIRYEDLNRDPVGLLSDIQSTFQLECRNDSIRDTIERADPPIAHRRDLRRDVGEISAEDRSFVLTQLDPELEARLGYSLDPDVAATPPSNPQS
ncbi:hypothetical protein D3P04_07130 [Paracoccus onubensis]|uniref:Sulfotransferase family protein n=2 Tax=Paracoccus onubensis TaxID=1675788 RepID=A0A418SZU6_9RHOB|nr:hypothetical protein D3P04_07130 [Paracoccus onubensis]